MTDPHRVLGVAEDATQEEITSAYHRLVRRYHPDTATSTEPDRFHEVVAAYDVLRGQVPRARDQSTPPKPPPEPAIRVGPVRYHGPPHVL
ncbi:J domain-containing protein [Actinophytocola sp.]|uniref:J domain-containing protein n=1 Tax=Actinophytocola sp. TaxID=1872138 RepID=UPI002ED4A009